MNYLAEVIIIWCVLRSKFVISQELDFSTFDAPCRRNDPNLNQCLKESFQKNQKAFASGEWWPSLEMRPMDPFNLQNHTYGTDAFMKLITHNMTVHGLSNYIVERYEVNLRDFYVEMRLHFPRISDTGIYSANINIFGMTLDGDFRSSYRNTRATIRFDFHKEIHNGTEFVNIDSVFLRSDKVFRAIQASHPIHNIYIPVVYPLLERSYGEIIREEINKLLARVPFDILLPEK